MYNCITYTRIIKSEVLNALWMTFTRNGYIFGASTNSKFHGETIHAYQLLLLSLLEEKLNQEIVCMKRFRHISKVMWDKDEPVNADGLVSPPMLYKSFSSFRS